MKKFMKVKRLGSKEVEGITTSGELIYQEKLDGQNMRLARIEGELRFGSRKVEVDTEDKNFGRAVRWCQDNLELEAVPDNHVVFGEWLKPLKVKYHDDSYHQFYKKSRENPARATGGDESAV